MSFATTLNRELSEYMVSQTQIDLRVKDILLHNLLIVHSIIVASENLLKIAHEQTSDSTLKDYYAKHLAEERHHASWLAEDLKTADVEVQDFNTPKAIREMVGAVYYAIYHESPTALLGYMLLLESQGVSLKNLERLEEVYGKELLRTMRHHSIHDIEHTKDILRMIDLCTIKEQFLIKEIAFQSAEKIGLESRALAA